MTTSIADAFPTLNSSGELPRTLPTPSPPLKRLPAPDRRAQPPHEPPSLPPIVAIDDDDIRQRQPGPCELPTQVTRWSDANIERFFVTRFEKHFDLSVQYWRIVRAIANDLLGQSSRPGIDFALTEIVRCKSWNERLLNAHHRPARPDRALHDDPTLDARPFFIERGSTVRVRQRLRLLPAQGRFTLSGVTRFDGLGVHRASTNVHRRLVRKNVGLPHLVLSPRPHVRRPSHTSQGHSVKRRLRRRTPPGE